METKALSTQEIVVEIIDLEKVPEAEIQDAIEREEEYNHKTILFMCVEEGKEVKITSKPHGQGFFLYVDDNEPLYVSKQLLPSLVLNLAVKKI